MDSQRFVVRAARTVVPAAILFLVLAFIVLRTRPIGAEDAAGHGEMTDAAMKAWVDTYYSQHPEVGLGQGPSPAFAPAGAFADTFTTPSNRFDTDGNLNTGFDSTSIFVDEAILWINTHSSHTVTSGIPGDADAGSLFDMSLGAGVQRSFTFTNAGRFPFFCIPHSGTMRGVVNVRSLVGVIPVSGEEGAIGFVSRPSPNPATNGVTFRFAVREAGRARLEVLDVRGRVVARPVEGDYGVGTYAARWDRASARWVRAPAGVYFLRLTVPGAQQSERVVIAG